MEDEPAGREDPLANIRGNFGFELVHSHWLHVCFVCLGSALQLTDGNFFCAAYVFTGVGFVLRSEYLYLFKV